MPKHIGTFERSVGDDYPLAVDLSPVDVFGTNAVTGAVVAALLTPSGVTAPTLGTVTVATNVCTFRCSGGSAGSVTYSVTATNAASTPNVAVFAFTIKTE